MKEFQILYLNDTDISDAGLMHVRGLTSLDVLKIDGTNVTKQGIERLRKSLANTSFYSGHD